MRSSGSTRNRRASPIVPLFLVVVGDDHPRACTGRKLLRAGWAKEIPARGGRPPSSVLLLDPHAEVPLSPADGARARSAGLLGVDCSWNALERRGGFARSVAWLSRLSGRRRLPWLLAGNPQHFGRLAELNTVEAFAAALYILGERDRSRTLLTPFSGGSTFLELNRPALESYAGSTDADAVLRAEREADRGPS